MNLDRNYQKIYDVLRKQDNHYAIQIDSWRAENSELVSQLQYLEKYYGSIKKNIPELKEFEFIRDTVTNTGK